MQGNQIQLGQSLRSAQQFLDTHGSALGAVNESDARHQLDAAIAAVDASTVEQDTRRRETRGEVRRRSQLEEELVRRFMTPLAKFARAQLAGAADFAALTPSGNRLERERLVQSARSMAAAARPHAGTLTAAKFPADFLQQLEAAADAVRKSLDTRVDGRVKQTGATKQVATALRQGRNAIATLDALVSHVIRGDARLEREWRTAKRVPRPASRGASPGDTGAEQGRAGEHTAPVVARAAQEEPLKDAA